MEIAVAFQDVCCKQLGSDRPVNLLGDVCDCELVTERHHLIRPRMPGMLLVDDRAHNPLAVGHVRAWQDVAESKGLGQVNAGLPRSFCSARGHRAESLEPCGPERLSGWLTR